MRLLSVVAVIAWCGCCFVCRSLCVLLRGKNGYFASLAGEAIANACSQLGGAFLKAGQILSTRVDFLPATMIESLAHLRDNVRPLRFSRLQGSLQPLRDSFNSDSHLNIASTPLASATIAQVHIGTYCPTGRQFAIKVRRPGIDRLLAADVRYIRFFTSIVAHLPWFRKFPISEATNEICSALLHQVDFITEARMLERFHRLFSDNPRITIPEVDLPKCTDEIIVMEYLNGFQPIQEFREQPEKAKAAVQTGLRALYKMIFQAGLIHCDLHSSNILCNEEGRVALLDFGFVSEMTPKAKQDFAEFFLSIAFRDGKTAARIVRETALQVSEKLNATEFECDMQVLVENAAGRKAADFQVAGFVFELFQVQRRHGIYGSPSFTLPILSLLTYEGLIKDIHPEIDFQQEAVPFVMAAMTPQQ